MNKSLVNSPAVSTDSYIFDCSVALQSQEKYYEIILELADQHVM